MCFFSRPTHVQIWLLRRNVLSVVYNNWTGQQGPKISRQLNMYGTWWSGNLLFLQSLPQPLPNCDNGCKMLRIIYCRMTFGTFTTVCMQKYTPALPQEGVTLSIDMTVWAPLTVTCFIWSEFVIVCYYNDRLSLTSIFNTMNVSLKVLHFFGSVTHYLFILCRP